MDSKLSILLSLVDLTLFDPPDMEEPPLGAGESRMVVLEAERPLLLKSRSGHQLNSILLTFHNQGSM